MPRRISVLPGITLLVSTLAVPVALAAPAAAEPTCRISFAGNAWSTGFANSITVVNLGPTVTAWTITVVFADPGQRVGTGWPGGWEQDGLVATLRSQPWNGQVATGASVTVGMVGTHTGANPPPRQIRFGDCASPDTASPPAVVVTAPAAGTSVESGTEVTLAASARDADGTVGKVEFYADAALVGTDVSAPYSVAYRVLRSVTVTARAYDDQGLVTTSAGVRITAVVTETSDVLASPRTVPVPENGSAPVRVTLGGFGSRSNVTVTVTRTSGDPDLVADPPAVRFAPEDWAGGVTPVRIVTLTAADDADAAAGTATFTLTAPGFRAVTVTATETDDDGPAG